MTAQTATETATAKTRTTSYVWTVTGVAEGEVRTLREARNAIGNCRRRVGHLAATITRLPQWTHERA